jgi:hypothetical protein
MRTGFIHNQRVMARHHSKGVLYFISEAQVNLQTRLYRAYSSTCPGAFHPVSYRDHYLYPCELINHELVYPTEWVSCLVNVTGLGLSHLEHLTILEVYLHSVSLDRVVRLLIVGGHCKQVDALGTVLLVFLHQEEFFLLQHGGGSDVL